MKVCSSCKIRKVNAEFPKNRDGKYGIHSLCTDCKNEQTRVRYQNNVEKERIRTKIKRQTARELGKEWAFRSAPPSKARAGHLKRRYGLTLEQFDQILESQGGVCYICRRPPSAFKKSLHIDHAHTGPRAGVIRGALCWACNTELIGKHIDPSIFERAAAYLRQDTGLFVPENMVNPKIKRKRRHK